MSQTTQDGIPYSYVKLLAAPVERDLKDGRFFEQTINPVPTNRTNILISSNDKTSPSFSDFNFYVDLRQESSNLRSIQLLKCILPLLPQINDHNNIMSITLNGITGTVTLDNGFYNPNSFVNMLQSKFSTFWNATIPGATVTVSYNVAERNITVEDNSPAPGPYNFQFNSSIFSSYGIHVANFPLSVSSTLQTSTSLEMVFSRFYTVHSNRLCDNQRASSLTSSYAQTNMVAIVPCMDFFDNTQFSPSSSFPGTSKTFDVSNTSPVINTTNKNISLRVIDFRIDDEFGNCLDTIYSDGSFKYSCAFLIAGHVY